MEPRPSRPRSTPSSDRYPAGAFGPVSGTDAASPSASAPLYAPDLELVRRGDRRRRSVLRIAAIVALLAVIVGVGWNFRDRLPTVTIGTANQAAVPAVDSTPDDPGASTSDAPAADVPAGDDFVADSANGTEPQLEDDAEQPPGVANLLATATPPPADEASDAEADPTVPPEPQNELEGAEEEPAPPAEDETDDTGVALAELLPTEADLPLELPLIEDADRSLEEVVGQLGNAEEATLLLEEWGWEGNAYRIFQVSQDAVAAGDTFTVNVSAHRFADEEAADNALIFFSDYVVAVQGLEDDPGVETVGDATRALRGSPEGLPVVVLYVRDGSTMYRIGGSASSLDGDPTADVIAVAEAAVAR